MLVWYEKFRGLTSSVPIFIFWTLVFLTSLPSVFQIYRDFNQKFALEHTYLNEIFTIIKNLLAINVMIICCFPYKHTHLIERKKSVGFLLCFF